MAPLLFFLALGFLHFPSLLLCVAQGTNDSNSKPSCPELECPPFGFFGFPFYSSDPRCGLCRLDCNETVPRIQLSNGDQRWYDLTGRLQNNTIVIRDNVFADRIRSRDCDAFHTLTFPNTSSIFYSFSPPLTLMKCNSSPEVTRRTDRHFNDTSLYHRYRDCRDFNLYYKYPANYVDVSDRVNLPRECVIIQLPHLPQGLLPPGANQSDLFQILAANINLDMHISENCLRCHYNGGQCQNNGRDVHCIIYATKEAKSKKVVITTVVIGSAVILVIFCLAFFLIRRRYKWSNISSYLSPSKSANENIEALLKKYGPLAPERYRYSDIKKMTNSFKEKLGQGGYGGVYKGKLPGGRVMAVKILNKPKGSGEDFVNEVASISRTYHVNIVSLLGFCFEGTKRALIYEFMPNGSLEKFIYNDKSTIVCQLGWKKLHEVALGIARGLEYLHRGCNMRILHFDIKPHNILLSEDFLPKISDFGLAKLCPDKNSVVSMSGMRGTPGYIAPELFFRNYGGASHKSDVYSYGMMIIEMVGGIKNSEDGVDHPSEKHSEIYFPDWLYNRLEQDKEIKLDGIANEEEDGSTRKMILVGLWCIQTDPSDRPSMTKVVEMLEGSVESLQIPPRPVLVNSPKCEEYSSTTLS